MTAEETAAALALGAEIRRRRLAAEVGQRELARLINRREGYVWALEHGHRRVRRSALEAMAGWLIPFEQWFYNDGPADWQEEQVVAELVRIGGPAIAPERGARWGR